MSNFWVAKTCTTYGSIHLSIKIASRLSQPYIKIKRMKLVERIIYNQCWRKKIAGYFGTNTAVLFSSCALVASRGSLLPEDHILLKLFGIINIYTHCYWLGIHQLTGSVCTGTATKMDSIRVESLFDQAAFFVQL